jgi:hypothetical protein
VSPDLALEAGERARSFDLLEVTPLVADLDQAPALAGALNEISGQTMQRIFLFFGVLPNMLPSQALSILSQLLRPSDFLVFSANLSPSQDYQKSILTILPQYDNPETRDWLLTFLAELNIPKDAGKLSFQVRPSPDLPKLLRIEGVYTFNQEVRITIANQSHGFNKDDQLLLFFSNRYTPELVYGWIQDLQIEPLEGKWINSALEEGVFAGTIRPPTPKSS